MSFLSYFFTEVELIYIVSFRGTAECFSYTRTYMYIYICIFTLFCYTYYKKLSM